MKAYLVDFAFRTRVVVPDDATEDQIARAAVKNMEARFEADMFSELMCNQTKIKEDTEVPYNRSNDFPGQWGYHDFKTKGGEND